MHGMGIRLTIDADLVIHDAVAVTDFSPFRICPNITPNFRKLIGLNLGKGFSRAAREVVGGTKGCVHLVDLLDPIAATAHQTFSGIRHAALQAAQDRAEPPQPPSLGMCRAWAADSPVVKHAFPAFYTGP